MKFLSVCSGIEAASVAWEPLGWKAVAFSEIEPFPCSVLAHHYPDVPNVGDMTTIAARILAGEIEAPDLLVGGTPCQGFSMAGLRQSLADPRGQLILHYINIANAIDTVRRNQDLPPCICVWENVPGVLNTKDNAFGCFLGALSGSEEQLHPPGGKWSNAGCVRGPEREVAWRILDAQHFGVAQRRRRVFVVASADLGCPSQVLFERKGMPGCTQPGGEVTEDAPSPGHPQGGPRTWNCNAAGLKGYRKLAFDRYADDNTASTMKARDCKGFTDLVVYPAYAVSLRGMDGGYTAELGGEQSACLRASQGGGDKPYVLAQCQPLGFNVNTIGMNTGVPQVDLSPTLTSNGIPGVLTDAPPAGRRVRRLTPTECERLQGFPDGWTQVPHNGKPAADTPRYKALGNSMAVPVMRWIGERINRAEQILS